MKRLLIAVGVALLVVSPAEEARAERKPREVFAVIIDGKPLKVTKRLTGLTYSATVLSLSAASWPNQGRGLQRFLGIDCVRGETFVSTTTCYGYYSEERYGIPTSARDWGGLTMVLTVDAYDGEIATGRFGGVLQDSQGGAPPIVVEGFFSLPLRPRE